MDSDPLPALTFAGTLTVADVEKASGSNAKHVKDTSDDIVYEVTLDPEDDAKQFSLSRKWLAVLVICSSTASVTCSSSIAAFTETGIVSSFYVSNEVSILGVSLYILGLGAGALVLGPISTFYGRVPVYRISYFLTFILSWPIAFSPNIVVFLVFRSLVGFCGAALLTVSGGSISDLFSDEDVENPMAAYTLSVFIGIVLGPLMSGFINQHLDWQWTYRVQLIWTFVELILILLVVPETYGPILCKFKAIKLRASSNDSKYYAPLERNQMNLFNAVLLSCYRPYQILTQDLMAFLICLWNAFVIAILYIAFQVFPIIFEDEHGFNLQSTGLSLLGIGIGMIGAWVSLWGWKRLYKKQALKYGGKSPPEMRMLMGMVGGILVPVALLLISLTSSPSLPSILPILLATPFGTGILYIFMSSFTYLVTVYRPYAASVLAANTNLRCLFSAGFPLFAKNMYDALGVKAATGVLAGITGAMAVLPFVLYKYGDRIRQKSKFAILS